MSKRIAFLAVALTTVVATSVASAQTAPVQATIVKKGNVLTSVQGTWTMTMANGQDLAGNGARQNVTARAGLA